MRIISNIGLIDVSGYMINKVERSYHSKKMDNLFNANQQRFKLDRKNSKLMSQSLSFSEILLEKENSIKIR